MKRHFRWLIYVSIFVVCAFGVGRQIRSANVVSVNETGVSRPPDHVIYRMLFHHVELMRQMAAEADRNGDSRAANAYRKFLIGRAELSAAQSDALHGTASRCEILVGQLDLQAKAIIDLRRKTYSTTGTVLPRSDALDALQEERNRTILNCRDELRQAFGEDEWMRFDSFVQHELVPNISTSGAH